MAHSKNRRRLAPFLASTLALAGAGGASFGQCTGFTVTSSTGAMIVPGTVDSGNHGDDDLTTIPLPFPISLYGASYSSAVVCTNGTMQFTTSNNGYDNHCLPDPSMGVALLPHWDDLRTDQTGKGIYTSVTGAAPNRVFNVEWRAVYYNNTASSVGFEVRLYEDNSRVEFVYGAVPQSGASATVGIQHPTNPPNQFECSVGGLASGLKLTFTPNNNPALLCAGGAASPGSVYNCAGATTLLTVSVTPGSNPPSTGMAVTADLSAIGGSGPQQFYDDGTHGDAVAGNNTFSYAAVLSPAVAAGGKIVNFSVQDSQGRSGTGSISLSVMACPTAGPDVYVGDITDVAYFGNNTATGGDIYAYAVGTDACNLGDVPVLWYDYETGAPLNYHANQHPVIAQNFYRYNNGRFEQIGQSWLKHGFTSTNSSFCAACQGSPQGGDMLGVGCSDAYGASLNGSQSYLGPRSEVNATTGVYPWPHGNEANPGTVGMRLQCHWADVNPTQNAGARYFCDGHYVTADDASYVNTSVTPQIHGNGLNNATWREINMSNPTAASIPFVGTLDVSTNVRQPGIRAWQVADPGVVLADADYLDSNITARFIVGAKVTSNGNGTWTYEYAVYNHNADRAGGSFSVPLPFGAIVSNVGFHDVDSHSGEPYSLVDWTSTVSSDSIAWNTETYGREHQR